MKIELRAVARLKLIENLNPNDEQLLNTIEKVIKNLTEADYILAETILNKTEKIDIENDRYKRIIEKFIAKAEKELVKAKENMENNKPAKSILHSKMSWHWTQMTVRFIER